MGSRGGELKGLGLLWVSQVALVVKNLPANAGDLKDNFDPWVWKIDALLEGIATHSSILARKIPTVHRVAKTLKRFSTHSTALIIAQDGGGRARRLGEGRDKDLELV